MFFRGSEDFAFPASCGKISLAAVNIPAGNYMFKVNNRNIRTRCQICQRCLYC